LSETDDDQLTIDELSRRTGMSVRNIRAHQSRGLIPPPQRRGRQAYYGPAHQRALARIDELQQKGYNLAAVEQMMRADADRDLQLLQTVLAPLLDQEEVVLTQAEMAGMFALTPSPQRLGQALDAELVRDLGDGRYAAPSRRLLDAVCVLVEQGVPIIDLYGIQLDVAHGTRDIARRFVDTCVRCAWEGSGAPPSTDRADELRQRFDDLRRQFTVVIAATFAVNVRRATEQMLAELRVLAPPVGTGPASSDATPGISQPPPG
jgi:DNA-binding transcriptional MerR regulator